MSSLHITVGITIALSILFFSAIQWVLSRKGLSQKEISCITSLIHHTMVTIYCFCWNYSFIDLLNSSFSTFPISCDTTLYSTPYTLFSGIFTVVYLSFDAVYDLAPDVSKNKLLIFHHVNGVVLISCALVASYGEYMIYIAHIMEISSIFLGLKELFKIRKAPEWLKLANDLTFALTFLVVRIYSTLASVFILKGLFYNNCLETFTFLDFLNSYTTVLYCILTSFWSFGILRKVFALFFKPSKSLSGAKDKEI